MSQCDHDTNFKCFMNHVLEYKKLLTFIEVCLKGSKLVTGKAREKIAATLVNEMARLSTLFACMSFSAILDVTDNADSDNLAKKCFRSSGRGHLTIQISRSLTRRLIEALCL